MLTIILGIILSPIIIICGFISICLIYAILSYIVDTIIKSIEKIKKELKK